MNRVPLIDRSNTSADRKALLDGMSALLGTRPTCSAPWPTRRPRSRACGVRSAPWVAARWAPGWANRSPWPWQNRNACAYCLAAHTLLGQKAGASAEEMAAAQRGEASDPKTQAALRFALKMVADRAQVSSADVQALRDAGFNDEGVVEIVAHVALNLFTNYVNVALAVPVDFPAVKLSSGA